MTNLNIAAGDRVTTRCWGGYESVKVVQVLDSYLIVLRFGQATDLLPKNEIEKHFPTAPAQEQT